MPRQIYPFIRFKYADGQTEPRGHTRLPVQVTNPATQLSALVWGLVDTGADASLFPADLAEAMGHNLKGHGVRSSVTCGIEQSFVTVYKHTFRLDLLSPDTKRVVWSSSHMEIDCVPTNPPVLLGVADFLRHFVLTVDYKAERILLAW
jgi:hypothetical protein